MVESSEVAINGTRYLIASDTLMPTGKRAFNRTYRASNAADPSRIQRVEWFLGGEIQNQTVGMIGNSAESGSGWLGIDFCQSLDTRWDRRLLPRGKQNFLDLTGFDPPGSEGSYFGTAYFGTSYFGSPIGGGSSGLGPDVVVFMEVAGYLWVLRGPLLTQIDPTTTPWTVISTTVLHANARDAEDWRGLGYIAEGPSAVMQRIVGASVSGPMLEDVTALSPAGDVYANAVKRGSDRMWYVNAYQGNDPILGVSAQNYAQFTLDDFDTLAAPFQVGDPMVGATGIGPFGQFTLFGYEDSIYPVTDQGKPTPLSRALMALHSSLNGKQFADPGWGWSYYTSVAALRANAGGADNPVGVGEAMRNFTGHTGVATAIFEARGELPMVYQTPQGDLYGYRAYFGDETAGTGQPLLFPWFYDPDQTCNALFTSTLGAPDQHLWLIRAQGTNLTYELVAANGRDDLDSDYEYACVGTDASWELGVAFDADPADPTNATYVSLGSVTTSGYSTLLPDDGGTDGQGNPTPTAAINGRTLKPRLKLTDGDGNTYYAYLTTLDRDANLLKTLRLARIGTRGMDSDTEPPEVYGTVELEYEERPQFIEEINLVLVAQGTAPTFYKMWQTFLDLASQQQGQPIRIQLPNDLVPAGSRGQKYGFIAGEPQRVDLKEGVEGISVLVHVWPQASVLT